MKYFFFTFLLAFSFSVFAAVSTDSFLDVSSDYAYKDAIEYMKDHGVVQGYEDGSYKPDNTINRAEFLKIVLEGKEEFSLDDAKQCVNDVYGNSVYLSDVPKTEWYAPYVCYAIKHSIIQGYPDRTFQAENDIIVPEMAKIIANTQGLSVEKSSTGEAWYTPFVKAMEDNKALPLSFMSIEHKVTRGEMAESLYRVKEHIETKDFRTFEELTYGVNKEMGEVASCQALADIMKSSSDYSPQKMYTRTMEFEEEAFEDMVFEEAAEADGADMAETSSASDDYSETNIQVSGVDEADIIKNDGKYIYLIRKNTVRIVDAYPSETMQELSMISFDDTSFQPEEMFLSEGKLTVIGHTWRSESEKPLATESLRWMPRYWGTQLTKVYIVNVENHEKPRVERMVSYEGNYSSARRIGDIIYLIVNKTPDYHILRELDRSAEEIIPFVEDSVENTDAKPACACADIEYFPGYESPNYMIVSAIPLDTEKTVMKKVFLGASENVYMSKQALYIATGAPDITGRFWNYDNTQVYKFSVDDMDIDFIATSKVPGRILNQFSMDEYKNNFRIATTKGEVWGTGEVSTNRLYVLDDEMKQVGSLEDIAPGERIYSVRFMGDRAFMVTFKTVDPLFVISLKDPSQPQVLGQLKIPGWSDYLHPYDENHLIGFGKEVDESIDADKVHSDNAVYYTAVQGMKISLFDVTDVENPKEIFKEVIGDRGTNSELLQNHKALLFSKEKDLLAFPVTITKNMDPEAEYGNIQTIFSGAIVYTLNLEDGFQKRGQISHYEDDSVYKKSGEYFYGESDKNIQRIIYIGDNLYTISPAIVKAADMQTVKEKSSLELGEKSSLNSQCQEKVQGIGMCEAYFTGYEFDETSGKCMEAGVSGCSASIPFSSLQDCQKTCEN